MKARQSIDLISPLHARITVRFEKSVSSSGRETDARAPWGEGASQRSERIFFGVQHKLADTIVL